MDFGGFCKPGRKQRLMTKINLKDGATETPETPSEALWELRSGCPKPGRARLFSRAETPLAAALELLDVINAHPNVLHPMQTEEIDGKTVYIFPRHCGWPIHIKAV